MKSDTDDLNFRAVIKLRESIPSQALNKAVPCKNLRKVFSTLRDERLTLLVNKAKKLENEYTPPDFLRYYYVNCEDEGEAYKIVEMLREVDAVELSYVESYFGCPPSVDLRANGLSSYQEYLNPAPLGIDARYAWTFCGGDGSGNVRFIDVEQGWFLDHEDLAAREVRGTGLNHWEYKDHGAAVLGVIAMQDNTTGGVGITPRAKTYVVSQWRGDGSFNSADAIMAAIDFLRFGDILLLEAQVFDVNAKHMWPLEILDANFQAIRLATALGIIVIEPAANGLYFDGRDLDKFSDDKGKHIFNRSRKFFKDSGSILVAAASSDVPHKRIDYSNYGSRIDCYAWGENVFTAGLYPRSSRGCTDTYSHNFGGTSSASAIIAGAAIALQSITEAKYNSRLSPTEMRNILSGPLYGTKSENGHAVDKIGVMPDLRKIINRVLKSGSLPEGRLSKRPNKVTRQIA